MRRRASLAERRRRARPTAGLAALIMVIAAFAVIWSGVAFALAPADPTTVATSGSLYHTNSREGFAIVNGSGMRPGDAVQGTVTITNSGDLPGTFWLETSDLSDTPGPNGGKLSDLFLLEVVDQTTGITIYDGKIASVGTIRVGLYAAGASRTYRFTVTFPHGGAPGGATSGDDAYQGSSMSIQFNWIQA